MPGWVGSSGSAISRGRPTKPRTHRARRGSGPHPGDPSSRGLMDPNALAGMIFTLIIIGMVGGFILLFPLSRRMGALLDVWLQEKKAALTRDEAQEIWRQLQTLEKELGGIAERQHFTERLLESRHR